MTTDRVRPLKLSTPVEGGNTTDMVPTEVNPHVDGVDAAAYFLQNPTSADATTYLSRSAATGAIVLTDATVGSKASTELVSSTLGAVAAHQSLVDIIHFLDEGPGDGWASGAYQVQSYNGILLTSSIWYTSTSMATKILAITYAYASGAIVPTTKTWQLYNAAGSAVIRTIVDYFTFNNLTLVNTKRTWS